MTLDYCSQLSEIPEKNEKHIRGKYICKITEKTCLFAKFEDSDPGHPASYESWTYDNHSVRDCPAYSVTDEIAKVLKKNILEIDKKILEDKKKTLDEKISKLNE